MNPPLQIPPHLDDVARLLSDASRLRMLWALGDGRSYTARELAQAAELSASAASNHLARLLAAGVVEMRAQGRHRYYAVTREDVARAVEALAAVTLADSTAVSPARPRASAALCHARRCYGHLAGECGVALWDELAAIGAIDTDGAAPRLSEDGALVLGSLGVADASVRAGTVQPCLDWTERRWHLGGVLGRTILDTLQRDGVLAASPSGSRVLLVDPHRWRAWLARIALSPLTRKQTP